MVGRRRSGLAAPRRRGVGVRPAVHKRLGSSQHWCKSGGLHAWLRRVCRMAQCVTRHRIRWQRWRVIIPWQCVWRLVYCAHMPQ